MSRFSPEELERRWRTRFYDGYVSFRESRDDAHLIGPVLALGELAFAGLAPPVSYMGEVRRVDEIVRDIYQRNDHTRNRSYNLWLIRRSWSWPDGTAIDWFREGF